MYISIFKTNVSANFRWITPVDFFDINHKTCQLLFRLKCVTKRYTHAHICIGINILQKRPFRYTIDMGKRKEKGEREKRSQPNQSQYELEVVAIYLDPKIYIDKYLILWEE